MGNWKTSFLGIFLDISEPMVDQEEFFRKNVSDVFLYGLGYNSKQPKLLKESSNQMGIKIAIKDIIISPYNCL